MAHSEARENTNTANQWAFYLDEYLTGLYILWLFGKVLKTEKASFSMQTPHVDNVTVTYSAILQ